jgi:hypothetical protein
VLQTMGLGRSDFERNGVPGYGNPFVADAYKPCYVPGVLSGAGELLPLLRA